MDSLLSVLAVAVVVSACDSGGAGMLGTTAPSQAPFSGTSQTIPSLTATSSCVPVSPTGNLTLVVTSSVADTRVDHVTIHMLDGTNLGGPSITIPQSQINTVFNTAFVPVGVPVTFVLPAVVPCTFASAQVVVGMVTSQGVVSVPTILNVR